MKVNRCHMSSPRASSQKGQTFIIIMMFVGLFLLAMLGVAADYTQVWAHRQMAQGAADAACQAGAADLFLDAVDPSAAGTGGVGSFSWIGNTYDCSPSSTDPVCKYAALNGYNTNVHVTFPSSLPGVSSLPPAFGTVAHPYIQVTVTDNVPMSFTKMVSSSNTVTITAKAGCGVIPVAVPVPLVILHKTATGALTMSGATATIKVFGGPQRSIQVDSNSANAFSGNGTVNLSQGGPADTGSDFAVFGGPTAKPANVNIGTTGHYLSPGGPIGDPFATVNPPLQPNTNGTATPVPFAINGCPDPNGCVEFTPGNYNGCTGSGAIAPGAQGCPLLPYKGSNPKFNIAGPAWQPSHLYTAGTLIQPTNAQHNAGSYVYIATNTGTSGTNAQVPNPWNQNVCARQADGSCSGGTQPDGTITWRNVGKVVLNQLSTGIFDPGLYYVGATNGLNFGDGSTARISTAAGDGSLGVMFYFSSNASVGVTSNSGKSSACTTVTLNAGSWTGNPNGCVVSYLISGALSPASTLWVSSQALKCPAGAANPPQVPSTLDGNILLGPCTGTYKSPDGNRGFLFFQNRTKAASPSWGGGGQFLSSGFMYFTSGNGATCGTNTSCLTLQGGSGSQSFTLGNIVVDELSLGGNPTINMILNPTATFQVLNPSLLQ